MKRPPADILQRWIRALVVTLAVLMVTVWEHVEAVCIQKQLRAMRAEQDQMTYQNRRMEAQISQITAPSNLDKIARTQLHMMPVDEKHIIGIEND